MSNMLEDGVASMMDTFLANAGVPCTYRSDTGETETMTLSKQRQMPQTVEISDGVFVEMMFTDFLGRWADLPFGEPTPNQLIEVDGEKYSVRPGSSGKCFRRMANAMVRIHTVQVQ